MMMHDELTIVPVRSRRDRERFVRFPWQVYAGNPYWVAPLLGERRRQFDPQRNPFFARADVELFLARRGAREVGVVAVFIHHDFERLHGDLVAMFGFFEVLTDPPAARALIDAAAAWAVRQGARVLRGPYNFAVDNECGVLLNAYDRVPVLMTLYNPPYYPAYLEAAGCRKSVDWYAFRLVRRDFGRGSTQAFAERLQRLRDLVQQRQGLVLRRLDMQHFDRDIGHARTIYNGAWRDNQGFLPLADGDVAELARQLRPIVDPDLVWIAEDGIRPVAMAIALPDVNQILRELNGSLLPWGWLRLMRGMARVDGLRMFALGVLPAYRRRGIEAVFYDAILQAALHKGYRSAELSLVVESNQAMRREVEAFGARLDKTYRIYERQL
jgi:GNAT superfamily N-acetyltransferase